MTRAEHIVVCASEAETQLEALIDLLCARANHEPSVVNFLESRAKLVRGPIRRIRTISQEVVQQERRAAVRRHS